MIPHAHFSLAHSPSLLETKSISCIELMGMSPLEERCMHLILYHVNVTMGYRVIAVLTKGGFKQLVWKRSEVLGFHVRYRHYKWVTELKNTSHSPGFGSQRSAHLMRG